jgi:hypothetical protein
MRFVGVPIRKNPVRALAGSILGRLSMAWNAIGFAALCGHERRSSLLVGGQPPPRASCAFTPRLAAANLPARFVPLRSKRLKTALVAAATTLVASSVEASGDREISSALVITKSSNKNEVHYAVQVDETCSPVGVEPVTPYWLMRERGPNVTERLSKSEDRVLGIARQCVMPGRVDVGLRAFPGRTLSIRTWQEPDGKCASSVDTFVSGVMTRLLGVYVKQRLFGISYVLLTGVADSGVVLRESVQP